MIAGPTFFDNVGRVSATALLLAGSMVAVDVEHATAQALGEPIFERIDNGLEYVSGHASPTFTDLDGDGDLDAVIGSSSGDIVVQLNTSTTPTAAFARPQPNPYGLTRVSALAKPAFVDLDGDGDLDAAIGSYDGDIVVQLNTSTTPTAAFAPPQTNPYGLTGAPSDAAPAFVDLDGDGDLDAAIGNILGEIVVQLNVSKTPTAEFAPPQTNPYGLIDVGADASPSFVDLDGDGDLDATIGELHGQVVVQINTSTTATAAFAPAKDDPSGLTSVNGNAAPAFIDLDGDGDLDATIGSRSGKVVVQLNTSTTPDAAFAAPQTNPYGLADEAANAAPAFVDMDGDGDLDAAIGNRDGQIVVQLNTSTTATAAFAPAQTNPYGLTGVDSHAAPTFVDLDGDGDLDAATGDADGDIIVQLNTSSTPTAAFAPAQRNPYGLTGVVDRAAPAFVDLDGDGDLDIAMGDRAGQIIVQLNTSTTPTAAFGPSYRPSGFTDVGAHASPSFVDLDGDGDLDAAIGNQRSQIVVHLNTSTTPTAAFGVGSANPYGLILVGRDAAPAFVDLDGDGDLDAVTGNFAGQLVVQRNLLIDRPLECFGLVDTMTATTLPDGTIMGTAGDDVIIGSTATDIIDGGGGNDTICGLGGDDTLRGGDGIDQIDGGDGADAIYGEAGNDDGLLGGPGDDLVDGGEGNDRNLRGQAGDDIIHAGPGNDRSILGNSGDDQIFGGPGDDTNLTGGRDTDTIDGGDGTDTCRTGETVTNCEDGSNTTTTTSGGGEPNGGSGGDPTITDTLKDLLDPTIRTSTT